MGGGQSVPIRDVAGISIPYDIAEAQNQRPGVLVFFPFHTDFEVQVRRRYSRVGLG